MKHYLIKTPIINPIILSIGPVSIYWYGTIYLISLTFALWYVKKNLKNKKIKLKKIEIEDLIFYCFLFMIIGGRIGYIIFYDTQTTMEKIFSIPKIWNGGMSFHGGLLGIILGIKYFCIKKKKEFFEISDFIIPIIPFGLALGRIGNFINGELYGRVNTKILVSFLFPKARPFDFEIAKKKPELLIIFNKFNNLPRHASQIYEFLFEGIFLFIIFYKLKEKKLKKGLLTSFFLIFYGVIRFILEFFREPDFQIGFIFNNFTMGQILSIPMFFLGIYLITNLKIKK
ncbi:Phosphatidylglycerol--prolipoprotein diacylglyceryl transferase [Buchnera aphidicola (Tetraneura ulmi)]|uniref:prolipoprotein diacylglyceryl transferase n=1 Tax=Buchnera aphidicola TaxID=9 RepID=UPI0034643241